MHTASTKGSSPRVRGRLMLAPPSRRAGRAHPRGCGADTVMRSRSSGSGGSSPRVRGRLQQTIQAGGGLGLIPAGAGQTPCPGPRRPIPRAHPRGCGADPCGSFLFGGFIGSSPRVRGRRVPRPSSKPRTRLIPAGAGQTRPRNRAGREHTAHPRGCGADIEAIITAQASNGSSPRVRGRLLEGAGLRLPRGLIPAGAGQTHSAGLQPRSRWAHPRGCGADPVRAISRRPRQRLIPAGAGQT